MNLGEGGERDRVVSFLFKARGRIMSTGRRRDCLEDSDGGKEGEMSQSTANMTINKDTMNGP